MHRLFQLPVVLLLAGGVLGVLCADRAGAQEAEVTSAPGVSASFGGELIGTFAARDDGYFNYSDYEDSRLRFFSAAVVGVLRFNSHVEALGEFRLQNRSHTASGLYLRVRPWRGRAVAIQAGRIPPVFGRFSQRGYGGANPLISMPLGYQYLTTLRPTSVPSGSDALLSVRGRGWLVGYPELGGGAGATTFGPGMPLVSATRWDTGAQISGASSTLRAALAVTAGSLSNPRVDDDNGGKQVAGRLTWRPRPFIDVGVSLARGAFLAREATRRLPPGVSRDGYVQTAVGVDAEVSSGYWVLSGETLVSRWTLPAVGVVPITDPLQAVAMTLEGRYRLTPRLHVAARGDRLLFSELISEASGGHGVPWDAPASRIEVGAGYVLSRQITTRIAWQYNWRDGVSRPRPREGFLAVQVGAWF